ncbi:hypothetical protein RJ639_027937 [Escallonia herrerae]|uniref:Alcohol dehydrogenase-like N-terminal domain-containing protein n=1 Tax=Escallonia herrerae TaxID=1293975 RepID=A0AA88X9C2_9ASTE|nr:hypothetical protein RJ639_027937 [Escallonia herrerae]
MGKGGMSFGDKESKDEIEIKENMAAWLLAVKNLQIQPYNLPPPGPRDVKVRVKAVGICGSDVHHFKPSEDSGSDRVALEPGVSCRHRNLCKDGLYNLCKEMKFFGSPPTNGSLANQVVFPANLCFKLPQNVSLEEGAMCEPLSVGVHACRRANIGPDTEILIMGAGPIGLVTMLATRAFGSPKIVITDVDAQRLSFAKDLGAEEIIQVSTYKEIDIIGIFRYRNTWPLCIELLRTGKLDVKPLITHRFSFNQEDVEKAFETSARGGNAIKVM